MSFHRVRVELAQSANPQKGCRRRCCRLPVADRRHPQLLLLLRIATTADAAVV
jgi:hypothetical protein